MMYKKNILFGFIVLFFVTLGYVSLAQEKTEEEKDEVWVNVQKTALVEQKEFSEFGGFVTPLFQSDLASVLSTHIEEIYVLPGEFVRKGDPLLRLDATKATLENESAYAQYQGQDKENKKSKEYYTSLVREAETFLDEMKKEKERTQEDSSEREVAEKNEAMAEASLESAKKLRAYDEQSRQTSLRVSEIGQELTKEYVSESIVRAPRDGKVSTIFVQEGDFAPSGKSLIRVSSLEKSVFMAIPSSQAQKLSLGDQVEIQTREKEGSLFASVIKIDTHNTIHSSSYGITLSLPKDDAYYEGMYVNALIETGEIAWGIFLDRSTLHSFYDDHFVFVVSEDGRLEKKSITLLQEYEKSFLVGGIEENILVVNASERDLISGMMVKIYE